MLSTLLGIFAVSLVGVGSPFLCLLLRMIHVKQDLYRKMQNLAALLLSTTQQHSKGYATSTYCGAPVMWTDKNHICIFPRLATSLGVKPGDRVLLVYPPGLEFIVAFLACLRAGAVAVPVYPPGAC